MKESFKLDNSAIATILGGLTVRTAFVFSAQRGTPEPSGQRLSDDRLLRPGWLPLLAEHGRDLYRNVVDRFQVLGGVAVELADIAGTGVEFVE